MPDEIEKSKENEGIEKKECFVIMPISDPEGYESGHFKMVYNDIFKPAIKAAGFKPHRVDDSSASHMIQLEIVKKIIEAPMAICDLSTRNPNVLFELGIRQAFDKPVVLLQETGTQRIFDISSINTFDYRKECIYSEVLEDQESIKRAIEATYNNHEKGECINSLIKLINIKPAELNSKNINDNEMLRLIFNEVIDLKHNINNKEIGTDKIRKNARLVKNNISGALVSVIFDMELSNDIQDMIRHELLQMSPVDIEIVKIYSYDHSFKLDVKYNCSSDKLSLIISELFKLALDNLRIKHLNFSVTISVLS